MLASTQSVRGSPSCFLDSSSGRRALAEPEPRLGFEAESNPDVKDETKGVKKGEHI